MSNIGAMMEAIDKWTPKSEADLFRICKEHKDNLAGAFDQNGWTLLHTAVYKEIEFIFYSAGYRERIIWTSFSLEGLTSKKSILNTLSP